MRSWARRLELFGLGRVVRFRCWVVSTLGLSRRSRLSRDSREAGAKLARSGRPALAERERSSREARGKSAVADFLRGGGKVFG